MTAATRIELAGVPAVDAIGIPADRRRAVIACHVWEGSNGYAGARALGRLGWETVVANEFESVPLLWQGTPARVLGRLARPLAVREFGRRIVALAEQAEATLFLAFKGTFVPADAVRELRRRGVLAVCHYPDVSATAHGPWLRETLREYDWVYTAKTFGVEDMARQLGVTRSSVLLHGFDPEVHRPVAEAELAELAYRCDVSFIGTHSPGKERALGVLRRALPGARLRVWGNQWERCSDAELRPCLELRPVEGRSYAAAIQSSTVNLALLSERVPGASRGDQVTSRTFHIPASGGLMAHQRTDEYLDLFDDGVEALGFGSDDEMVAVVSRALDDPAAASRVRDAGTRAVWGRDSWDHRVAEMLKHSAFDGLRRA